MKYVTLVSWSSQAQVLVAGLYYHLISSSVTSLQNGVNKNFLPCRGWPEHRSINNWQAYGDWGQFRPCPERGTNQSGKRGQGERCRKCKEKKLLFSKWEEPCQKHEFLSVNSVEKLWPVERGCTIFISCCFACVNDKHGVEATAVLISKWKWMALSWKSRSRVLCRGFVRSLVLLAMTSLLKSKIVQNPKTLFLFQHLLKKPVCRAVGIFYIKPEGGLQDYIFYLRKSHRFQMQWKCVWLIHTACT